MKPKTKKILIIVAAVLIVAAIVYFVFIRKSGKNSTDSIISKLDIPDEAKAKLRSMVDYINTSYDEAHKQAIAEKAASKGRTLAQQTVIEAAYSLNETYDLTDSLYSTIVEQVERM